MKIVRIGLDLAKNVFSVCGVEEQGKVAVRKTLRRDQVLAWFALLPPAVVGMERTIGRGSCGDSGTMPGSWTADL